MTYKVGSLPTPSYYSANLGGHRYCKRANIRLLNLSRDHIIKSSRDFEGESPAASHYSAKFGGQVLPKGIYKAFHLLFF